VSTIFVDGKPLEADPKKNLLHTCLSHGLNLEYFCWHPALGSVGACRQCAVKQFKDEQDTQGRIVMACMTPAADGTRISIEDGEAAEFRAAVIEGLMLNHPHDCPVCDEGGECHLQDMTVMAGHNYRSYEFEKRTFRNQDLGPLIRHEMNRCIQCYRCVRYYREYAGGEDLNSFLLHDTVFFGRQEDGVLENEFAGNLVEICPTGVFTDKTLHKHYTRKWDLLMAPSVCVGCGLGCNTSPGERYGQLRRIVNRYNGEVNGYFLCDRGRFGYEFVNSEQRIRHPWIRRDGQLEAATKAQALEYVAGLLPKGGARVIGIGSPRASVEANFALRELVGPDRFYAGIPRSELDLISRMLQILQNGPALAASLRDIEHCDAVLILGEDVTQTAPRMALSLRQSVRQQPIRIAQKLNIPLFLDHAVREAAQDQKGPFFIASLFPTRLDDIATATYRAAPDDVARLGFAVAREIDASNPEAPNLVPPVWDLAKAIAAALGTAERPLIVAGPSCGSLAVIEAAANIAAALCKTGRAARLAFSTPECNSFGLGLMEAAPVDAAFQDVNDGNCDTVLILENDLYRRAPAAEVTVFLRAAKHVVVFDQLEHETGEMAEVVLPAATFAESEGTLVNNEGRAQRFFEVLPPQGDVQPSWQWLRELIDAVGCEHSGAWKQLDDVEASLAAEIPALALVREAAPAAGFRVAGAKVPRAPHRYSGRTSMLANISVHEPKPPEDPDAPFSYSMEGASSQPPSPLIPFFWSPGWNSIQATNKFQTEIAGPLKGGDPGVLLIEPNGAASAHAYFQNVPAAFQKRAGEWLFVPRHHIFGSEELSLSSPAVAELKPNPYVALAPADATQLGLQAGSDVEINVNGFAKRLPVEILQGIPEGLAALPVGLPPLAGIPLPSWGRIRP